MTLLVLALLAAAVVWAWRRSALSEAGRVVLDGQPEEISFSRVPGDAWNSPEQAEWLARPLRAKGFLDLGVYEVRPLPGVKLGVMLNPRENVAAFISDRAGAMAPSLELNVRYIDGGITMLVNHGDNGVPRPPFCRALYAAPDAPSGELYERLLREREPFGIKNITAGNVLAEYQAAWTRIMVWEKRRGLTAAEVARIAALAKEAEKGR